MQTNLTTQLITNNKIRIHRLSSGRFCAQLSPSWIVRGHVVDELLAQLDAYHVEFARFAWDRLEYLVDKGLTLAFLFLQIALKRVLEQTERDLIDRDVLMKREIETLLSSGAHAKWHVVPAHRSVQRHVAQTQRSVMCQRRILNLQGLVSETTEILLINTFKKGI